MGPHYFVAREGEALNERAAEVGVVNNGDRAAGEEVAVEELLGRTDARPRRLELPPVGAGRPSRAAGLGGATAGERLDFEAALPQSPHDLEALAVALVSALDQVVAACLC